MALVGIAYSGYVPRLLEVWPDEVDFVEVTFELLRYNPQVLEQLKGYPVILHSASLNIAGSVRPDPKTLESLQALVATTRSPWVGEHLAFITAEMVDQGAEEYAPGEPYNLGFTVSPPMNSATVRAVVKVVEGYNSELTVPLLLENSPLYFDVPGSSMSQVNFVREICKRSDVRLLLDLTHFHITSQNMGFEPFRELEKYPLDRVDEIHISGTSKQGGVWWDDHACPSSDEVFELLALAIRLGTPRAVTLEYNWSARFSLDTLIADVERTRKVIGAQNERRV